MFRPVASGVSGVFSIYPASYPEYKPVENVLTGLIKVENGYAEAPHGPGLGIELNDKALEEFLTDGKSPVLVGKKA